jgi:2-polyprenyl-3-methyl-5-hydroxy-6-metoxy-1,4-benzoquinol methylase
MSYQHNYSLHFPATKDTSTRQRKANKIRQALVSNLQREDLLGLFCLDLGCSVGIISQTLASAGARIIGIDIDVSALKLAISGRAGQAAFVLGDVGAIPFPDESFDVLICSQVYEHAPSLSLLVQEIRRVLKTGGIVFFSGPNRWAVMEEHYHLPFLSWLPKAWADHYVRWSGRASEYYESPRSAAELRSALVGFTIHDLTPEIFRHPEQYAMEPEVGVLKYAACCVPVWIWKRFGNIVPNFNWLLVKEKK